MACSMSPNQESQDWTRSSLAPAILACATLLTVSTALPSSAPSQDSLLQRAQLPSAQSILDRLQVATLVFRGAVTDVRSIEASGEPTRNRRLTEHDPEWHLAVVRVVTPLRGCTAGDSVSIIFAGSRDIAWFKAPKLKPGQDAVFLAHPPSSHEGQIGRSTGLGAFLDKGPLYLVTEPYDVMQPSDEPRVRRLLSKAKER